MATAMTERERIAAALTETLVRADKDTLLELADALSVYKNHYPISWNKLQHQPFCWDLVDAIEQALELALE